MSKSIISEIFKKLSKEKCMCEICHTRPAVKKKGNFDGSRHVNLCSKCYDMVKF